MSPLSEAGDACAAGAATGAVWAANKVGTASVVVAISRANVEPVIAPSPCDTVTSVGTVIGGR
jgi:hypothetical protein